LELQANLAADMINALYAWFLIGNKPGGEAVFEFFDPGGITEISRG